MTNSTTHRANHKPFSSVLVANRGEIALRVMRTARSMGLRTIAIFSDADRNAPHVAFADEAVHIGPSPVGQSYLNIDAVIGAARSSGAEAIHPGYGFLSENAKFAQACSEAGLVFVGPSVEAIDLMGDKAKAKLRMIEAGVPCVPGYQGQDQSDERLMSEAERIGFPIMAKASAGGGGRGMRLITKASDLAGALKTARSEAENAFGSGVLILEKAIFEPRHVEVQVFGDTHGNVIHFGERDCSVQRRHQKVLEEAPCPVMTPELREAMGSAAVKAAADINYVGAGTVEFLLDKNGEFYFLEMNTRLQVEHPVTEEVTGIDLVALQFDVASGAPLPLEQDDITLTGHSIEARLYAEDTSQGFLPATGPIEFWRAPEGDGVRVDAGIRSGGEVSPFYDPMVAKIIATAPTRAEAVRRLEKALRDTAAFGFRTNRAFLIDALGKPDFRNGKATTAFIAENFQPDDLAISHFTADSAMMAATLMFALRRRSVEKHLPMELLNWTSASALPVSFALQAGHETINVTLVPSSHDIYSATIGDETINIRIDSLGEHAAVLHLQGKRHTVFFHAKGDGQLFLGAGGRDFDITDRNTQRHSTVDAAGAGAVVAPMHGMITEITVEKGAIVTAGQRLATLEAMKMQHELTAPIDGVIGEVNCAVGNQVAADMILIQIETEDA